MEVKYYVISDMHFGHEKLVEPRGFKTVAEMNASLIHRWNQIVTQNDTVYHVGDFALCKDKFRFIEHLNGNIVFIRGNHDPQVLSNIESMTIKFKGKDILLIHDPELAKNYPHKYVIHGHIHRTGNRTYTPQPKKKYYNANCEWHKFKPVLLNQALGELEHQEK